MIFSSDKRRSMLTDMFQLKIDMFSFSIYKHIIDKCRDLRYVMQYLRYRRKCLKKFSLADV